MDRSNLDAVGRKENQGRIPKWNQPKWMLDGKWFKVDHMGYEALAEVLTARLLKQSNVFNFVEYEPVLIQYQGKELPGCASKNFRLCPIFDHGLALLADLKDYPVDESIYDCISRVRARPFDMDVAVQVKAAQALYGPQLKFSFTQSEILKRLDDVRELYSYAVLVRVEQILCEQMKKYPAYFCWGAM